jgi:outer membrane lipoprotein-sorting protein
MKIVAVRSVVGAGILSRRFVGTTDREYLSAKTQRCSVADQGDSRGDRGRVSPAIALALVLVVGAVGGVAFAQSTADGPSGETILANAHDQYRNAETLTGSADVTVSNATDERSATIEYALAEEGARMSMTYNDTTMTAGTNESVGWLSVPEVGVQHAWNVANASSWGASEVCEAIQGEASGFDLDRRDVPNGVNVSAMQANVSAVDCESLTAEWADAERSMPANWSETNLTATRTGTETLDGTEAYVVEVEHENESIDVDGTIWVATENDRVLKQRVSDGTNATVVRYDDQRFNVSIDETTFAPPAARDSTVGSTTYDQFEATQDATDRDLATLDADGFAFEGAVVTNAGGGTTVAQQYADGASNATVVTTDAESLPYDDLNGTAVSVNGQDATAATMEGGTVVVWTGGDITYAVVSDRTTDETVTLAESVSG